MNGRPFFKNGRSFILWFNLVRLLWLAVKQNCWLGRLRPLVHLTPRDRHHRGWQHECELKTTVLNVLLRNRIAPQLHSENVGTIGSASPTKASSNTLGS